MESCQNIFKLKEKDKAAFYFPAEEWVLPAASTKELEERKFAVDSGASMHVTSRSPTTVMTANGEMQTREEATVFVKELDLFVTVMLLEETPAVLSLGKLREDDGFSYHWTSGQKPRLIRNGKRIDCNVSNYVPFVVPGLSTSSSTTPTPTSSSSSSQDSAFDVDRYTENPVQEVELRVESFGETLCTNPQKPKTKIKMRSAKKYKEIYRMNCLIGYRNSDESTSTEPWRNPAQVSRDTSKSSHELPMEPRAKVDPGSGT